MSPREELTEERRAELKLMLSRMSNLSSSFYAQAVSIGAHPFIELTGFMNEYIKIAQDALNAGIDFAQTNIHVGGSLPIADYQAAYLGEKFGCIFATTFHGNPQLLDAFLSAAELAAEKKRAPLQQGAVPDGP
jgi:hypothetical protein